MKSKSIYTVVTGGRGAIGSSLAIMLQNDGRFGNVIAIDNLSAGEQNFSSSVGFEYCDICNQEKISNTIKAIKPTYVFHLAAHFANQNSVDYPSSDAATNIGGTINLFESLRQTSSVKKVVYASSSCVYGNRENMSEDENIGMLETPYAITKFSGELYAKYYSDVQKIPSTIVRVFNTYGPGEAPGRYRNVIPNFINNAISGLPLVITGSGNALRDFTYVTDTSKILMLAALSEYSNGEVFNGGTGIGTKIKDLAEIIIRATQSKSKISYQDARSWDHVVNRCSNINKSKLLLKYNPSISIEEGIEMTIPWIRNWRLSREQQ
jgi:UDP-glucose 4-epimerase